MQIAIDNNVYDVEIIKKNNRNTYIRVKNGKIIVTTNYLSSKSSIKKLIEDNLSSIEKMIDIDNKKNDKEDNFYYFGKKYDVIYGFNEVEISSDRIYAPNKQKFDKYILKEITNIYQSRLDYWYNVFEEKIPVPNLKIRKMTSRWGVCNIRSHNVTLNYNLSKYDICCLDYVIVHELSHFIHHEYKKCKKMLKE